MRRLNASRSGSAASMWLILALLAAAACGGLAPQEQAEIREMSRSGLWAAVVVAPGACPERAAGRARVTLSTRQEWQARAVPDPERGERRFREVGCNGCHTVAGVGGMVGPDLTEVGARPSRDPERWLITEDYIRASILEPDAFIVLGYDNMMPPPDRLGLSERDVSDIVDYLLTLAR